MPTKNLFALGIITYAFLVLSPLAHAQSSIEKAFVAKSKLIDQSWAAHDPGSTVVVQHAAWSEFLSKYVITDGSGVNLVAYGSVSDSDKKALQSYLSSLQETNVARLNRNEQYAFWINLYNASMVNVVLENYPIKSVREVKSNLLDLKGPFNDPVVSIAGKSLTLDNIESGIVRPLWGDARLHYAFNCAALGCPNLGKLAYEGKTISAQLDAAARTYINNSRGVMIKNGKVQASKIYFWYQEDFGGNEESVIRHLISFADPELKTKLSGKSSIGEYFYDWSLNSTR